MCSRRLFTLGGGIAVTLLVASSVFAVPLPSADQKCIDGYNNKLRLVSQTAGKDYRKCIKDGGKGTPGVEGCVATDGPGKISGKATKVSDLYTAMKCTGAEVIQQGATNGINAHVNGLKGLTHDIFGDPINDLTVVSVAKDLAKCQDKAIQRSGQALTEIIKAQRKCKKDGMKAGTIISTATLDATCGTFAQIDAGGKALAKLTKLGTDVTAACATAVPATDFPGKCSGSTPANLGTCLQAAARCRACAILNEADGQSINCDSFDDGAVNGSCFIPTNVGSHTCTLAPSSVIALGTQALPLGLSPVGSININCGSTTPNGKAACSCDVVSFGTLVITAIGDVCISPASCPSGEIDCDGGNSENVDLVADHNIGACANDTACSTACDAHCAGLGANYTKIAYGCEGFCNGGTNNNNPCTSDSQCPGGQCAGAEPVTVSHLNTCNCTCQGESLGGASPAGSLACEVGTQINVELPTNGICGDVIPPTIQLPPICGAVTTTTATGHVQNANRTAAKTIPPIGGVGTSPATSTGVGLACNTIASSTLTGLTLVGHLGFYDSVLGDIFSSNSFTCQ